LPECVCSCHTACNPCLYQVLFHTDRRTTEHRRDSARVQWQYLDMAYPGGHKIIK
jgi:hypothetical protein